MKSNGQIAYEGYRQHSDGKSLISGATIPEWADLPIPIQEAWGVAAFCVAQHLSTEPLEQAESTANMLRGMTLDPSIPQHAKEAMRAKIEELDAVVETFAT